jgi:hypothetical protein
MVKNYYTNRREIVCAGYVLVIIDIIDMAEDGMRGNGLNTANRRKKC